MKANDKRDLLDIVDAFEQNAKEPLSKEQITRLGELRLLLLEELKYQVIDDEDIIKIGDKVKVNNKIEAIVTDTHKHGVYVKKLIDDNQTYWLDFEFNDIKVIDEGGLFF